MATLAQEPEVGYPAELAKFAGRINDADAHEWVPPELWVEMFGEVTRPFAELDLHHLKGMKNNYFKDVDSDVQNKLTFRGAWHGKGPYAYGAYDMAQRLELMDYCGIDKQLIFPGNVAINALFLLANADVAAFFPQITGDRVGFALKMIKAQNDWVIRSQAYSDRVRPVGVLLGETPDALYAEAKRLIDAGVRCVWFPGSILPGGKSPAHNDLDKTWALLADSNTVATLHVGNEAGFFKTLDWREADAFKGWLIGEEISLDPWTLSTMPMASQNFTGTMVTGGVFERHPMLRLAAMETGAHWLGPLAHALDMWSANTQTSKWSERLPLKPSEYIARNVRCAGFPWEPIDKYINDNGLEDCYCYASDFPHVEGGTNPMPFWEERLRPLGPNIQHKFFVSNAQWIMPD
ncbi:amidohydrolase family protein [Rhizorhabdus argentea]|uniref:amidohydrolase family protein n=1 Tax=Rhizorhabdus argentea TaxID=1387174 RepID=UPI0030ED45A1